MAEQIGYVVTKTTNIVEVYGVQCGDPETAKAAVKEGKGSLMSTDRTERCTVQPRASSSMAMNATRGGQIPPR